MQIVIIVLAATGGLSVTTLIATLTAIGVRRTLRVVQKVRFRRRFRTLFGFGFSPDIGSMIRSWDAVKSRVEQLISDRCVEEAGEALHLARQAGFGLYDMPGEYELRGLEDRLIQIAA